MNADEYRTAADPTTERPRTRWPLPRRSATDRKLGGVAGGLGRAWNIDPILIRVAFVVLALFGGSGVLLYCAGWLTMRGDHDDVSAIEALAGRGRSSVSPALTLVLIVVGLASMGSIFSWGIPFWPVVVGAIILTVVLGRRRHAGCRHRDGSQWDDFADRAARWGRDFGDRASRWGQNVGERADDWFGGASATRAPGAAPGTAAPVATAPAAPGTAAPGTAAPISTEPTPPAGPTSEQPASADAAPDPDDLLTDRRTPPAWDPLGAAPFAWDLPEPSPAPGEETDADPATTATERRRAPGSAIGRVFLGVALIVGAFTAAGVAAHWWYLPWSAVTGIALGILAIGLAIAALRGRGGRMLIGHGIFLAVLTLALSVSGLRGTADYGQGIWTPATVDDVADAYYWNAGQATLDLSQLTVPAGTTVTTDVTIGAGQVTVLVPADTNIQARCSATVGQTTCLDERSSGVRTERVAAQRGTDQRGTFDITIHSNAGQAVLKTND
jgi:phage shock protein PspC (stress-responsive transcriptional regulator)